MLAKSWNGTPLSLLLVWCRFHLSVPTDQSLPVCEDQETISPGSKRFSRKMKSFESRHEVNLPRGLAWIVPDRSDKKIKRCANFKRLLMIEKRLPSRPMAFRQQDNESRGSSQR